MESTDILLSPVQDGNIVPSFAPIVAEIVDRSRRAAESNLPLFIIVQYDHESDKISFQEKLKKALVQEELRVREFDPVHNEAHGTGKLYPLLAKASAENAVCLVFGLPRTDGEIRADHEFVHYLNIYRDRIVHERIRMILMLPARDAEQFIFSAGDLWDFRHATYWLERPAIKSSDFQWSRMETQTAELALPEPDMAEIQDHIRNTRPLIEETGDPSEKAKLYLQLCQWLGRRNAVGSALEAALEGLQMLNDEASETRAELEYEAGNLLRKENHFVEAIRHLKTCVTLHKTHSWGKTECKAKCLEKIGDAQFFISDFSGAKSSFVGALSLYRKIGDRFGEANCFIRLGNVQMLMSDLSGAESSYGAALSFWREIRDRLGEANCLKSLGDLRMRMFDLSRAKFSYEAALPIYREIGGRLGEANCIKNLGDLQMRMSDLVGAKSSYGDALPIYREIGDRLGEANCLKSLGDLQVQMFEVSNAKSSYRDALPIYLEIGARLGEANCLTSQGTLMLAEGKNSAAFRRFLKILAMNGGMENVLGQQAALCSLARAAHSLKSNDQALLLAEESIKIGRRINDQFTQTLNFYLQLQIWKNALEIMPYLAAVIILRDQLAQINNPQEAAQYSAYLEQIQPQLPPEAFQAIETDPESIRAAAIAQARERFAQTGRDLLDPPPEP